MNRRNTWDSKNNIALTRLLINAGSKENEEFSYPMHKLLTEVRKEVSQVTHLNNKEKDKALATKGVGWDDILKEAERLYRTMTVAGKVRWPPQCNIDDSKAPPQGYGAHLTQYKFGNNGNGKNQKKGYSKNKNNGQHKKQSFKKKGKNSKNGSWKTERPKKHQLEKHVNGVPVYS